MTDAAALPPWIAEWIQRSGVREFTGESGSTGITDGEVVWLVNTDADGWSMLRRGSRGNTPHVVLGAQNADVAARSVASALGALLANSHHVRVTVKGIHRTVRAFASDVGSSSTTAAITGTGLMTRS